MTSLRTRLVTNLSRSWEHFRGNGSGPKRAGDEPPLRSELFSALQMQQHGKTLADTHTLSVDHFPERLLNRLGENENVLLNVRELLTQGNDRLLLLIG